MASEIGEDILDADLTGYRSLQELVPHQTFLCTDVSGNVVLLKRLEDDCLHRNQLHPSIKDRLSRVRELAHPRMATLRSVERWNGQAYLVWIYLDGETWDDAIASPASNLSALCSSLAGTVDALHEIGIVHGSIHGRNAIVRPDRQVWLTHVSPYLYTDQQVDIAAVVNLLRQIAGRFPAKVSARFSNLVNELETGRNDLREFSHLILKIEDEPAEIAAPDIRKDHRYRIQSIITAIIVAAAGVVLWIEIRGIVSKAESPMPTTFPSLRRNIGP